jgi:F0F1-type ATP synthase assembly protein I
MSRLLKRKPESVREKRALWRDASTALTLGWNLAIPIFGGAILGYLLDEWLKTLPIFTLGLIVLGIGIGFYNYYTTVRKLDAHNSNQDHPQDKGEPKP